MHAVPRFLIVAAALAGVAFLPAPAAAKPRSGPRSKHVKLGSPAEVGAFGRINSTYYPATKRRSARSRLVLTMKRLPARASFTLTVRYRPTAFDPIQEWLLPNEVVTNRFGRTKVVWDTQKGGTLPLGGALEDLVGRILRVEDGTQQLVLFGPFPGVP